MLADHRGHEASRSEEFMKDGIAIIAFISIGLLWPTWLQHHARGWKFIAFWAAPMLAFYLGWAAK